MRQVCLLASLLAAAAGELCANPVINCSLAGLAYGVNVPTGARDSNGCWTNTFINATVYDSLDWGAPKNPGGTAQTYWQSGLGAANPGNNYPITTSTGPDVRSSWGDGVQVQKAPTFTGSGTNVMRVDDLAMEYSTIAHSWVFPGASGTPNVASFAGHFGSASTPTGTNDHLLELANGGPLELVFLNLPMVGVWFQIASLSGINSLFVVKIQAFASDSTSLGTYTLTETANGTGGTCTTLASSSPTPCVLTGTSQSDAPYVGFYDPGGRIRSIYISVFNPSNLTVPIGFAIDSLELAEVPEPTTILMMGGGLAAIALYRRKRRRLSR
ncbi:MAG: PEP-CTERM sorting domain-containing protein [Bryobacteraceae bacterium]|jgi:hypothetical protein